MSEVKTSWADIQSVAVAIDALSDSFFGEAGCPYAPRLQDRDDAPWQLTSFPPANFSYFFDVSPGSGAPIINDHWISKASFLGDDADALDLPAPLEKMALNGKLFFLYNPDGCWCKTIFAVQYNADTDRYQLHAIGTRQIPNPDGSPGTITVYDPQAGCCQTLPIPTDALDYSQHVIPAGYAAQYNQGVNGDGSNPYWLTVPKCTKNESGINFEFHPGSAPKGNYVIQGAERDMQGVYIWPISIKWMEDLVTALQAICAASSVNYGITRLGNNYSGPGYAFLPVGQTCPLSLNDVISSLTRDGTLSTNDPGCISQETIFNAPPPIIDYIFCHVWSYDPTIANLGCGAATCFTDGQGVIRMKVYQQTIVLLKALVAQMKLRMTPGTASTCCPYLVESGDESVPFPHTVQLPTAEELKVKCLSQDPDAGTTQSLLVLLQVNGGPQSIRFDTYCQDGVLTAAPTVIFEEIKNPGDTCTLEMQPPSSGLCGTAFPEAAGPMEWQVLVYLISNSAP